MPWEETKCPGSAELRRCAGKSRNTGVAEQRETGWTTAGGVVNFNWRLDL